LLDDLDRRERTSDPNPAVRYYQNRGDLSSEQRQLTTHFYGHREEWESSLAAKYGTTFNLEMSTRSKDYGKVAVVVGNDLGLNRLSELVTDLEKLLAPPGAPAPKLAVLRLGSESDPGAAFDSARLVYPTHSAPHADSSFER
jgi:hypothetical protein